MKTIKGTLRGLTKKLDDAFDKLVDDPKFARQAHELGNLAGKMISGQRLYLEYKAMRDEKPESDFIDG